MKIIMVLVILINHKMELITEVYTSQESCIQQTELVRKDVKSINDNLYPIEIVSLACVPEVQEPNYESITTR